MDNPNSRLGIGRDERPTDVPPLHYALYQWLKQQQWASVVYEEIIRPAEFSRDDRSFLDPTQFETAIPNFHGTRQ